MTLEHSFELELIEKAQGGDQKAFATLVEDASRRMWAVAYSVCGNQHDAEDAMQDALTAIWKNFDSFVPRARFSTWAYRIASNAALQVVRRRREYPEEDTGVAEASTDVAVDSSVTATIVVREAMETLSDEFREALVLREYAGMSYAEIAEHQGINLQTVKSRINRGRTRLKEALIARGVEHA
ncbi:sigma-70 family RNA polymerase sigma factor [Corynebacterium breve]|uniref:Sigma-70 family RNA polymerase sigma factor n=1 Tax=Corynebacterium breve TaxID=3049799 RepID=A0ABY8VD51_9CORY|nr:sigma-70 family RNA polymerase sigma factor [Corynebacterium breve]WIM67257.1 sigma-70 family RNA polymerase sigma factor [Corynebacterium breve]